MQENLSTDEEETEENRNMVQQKLYLELRKRGEYARRKMIKERTHLLTIKKRQLKILGHKLRKEGLANVTSTNDSECKRGRGRRQTT